MDVQAVLPAYYRMKLREVLRERPSLAPSNLISSDDYLLADLVTAGGSGLPLQRYGYDFDDPKHAALDEKPDEELSANNFETREPDEPAWDQPAEYAHRFRVMAQFDLSASRRRMEDRVRRIKRAGEPCPHCSKDGRCSRLYIRCGDRTQFTSRENGRLLTIPHHCNYDPGSPGDHVLIVDDDARMREFCKSAFSLFLKYDQARIITARSAREAIDVIRQGKFYNRHCGLVISDIVMPGATGYDLVDELYYRNFNTEVLLMKAQGDELPPPEGYAGNAEVFPGAPFVSAILDKPFHSDRLVAEVRRLRFGRLI